uniref:Uncharacterized protein n=1 Tax=viral metagenome TaxID=1070528 RepID=A0A6C0I4G7_9ZZZZ
MFLLTGEGVSRHYYKHELYTKTFSDLVPDNKIDDFVQKVMTGLNSSNMECINVILKKYALLKPTTND